LTTGEVEPVVYVNGAFLPKSDAKISVFDQGLIFGDGVFETLVAVNGYLFMLDEHLDRLYRSAKAVKINVPKTRDELGKIILETVKRNNLRDAYVKAIVTRGVGSKPLLGRGDVATPTLVIFAVPPVSVVSEEKMQHGAKIVSSTIKRTHPDSLDPRIKSLNYLPNMLIRMEAIQAGADEAISYGFDGFVSEGGAENIWIVKDDVLFTPSHGVLEGITRAAVAEIGSKLGYRVMFANIGKYDVYQADEVFLCSTAGGIIPVTEVDSRRVGDGNPGPVTKAVDGQYREMLQKGIHGTPIF
jgi:branched-chain amino acid aminotransferase